MIPVYRPYLPTNSLKYAHEALDSTWISSQGPYIQKTTEKLQELLGTQYILLVNNGTSATHLVAKALLKTLVDSKQDQFCHKLIVPDNVYVAAWNSFLFDQKFDLHPIPADLTTWNFNLSKLDTTIKSLQQNNELISVLVVPNLGNILNVPKLKRQYPEVLLVEDNCEGFLGKYEEQYTGTASLASSISFFGNKTITSGEGGAVITQTAEMYDYLKCLHGQGQSSKKFIHQEIGYNYRMTNVQAAILYGQLEVLPEIRDRKSEIFERYRRHLGHHDALKLQVSENDTEHANWMFGLRIVGNPGYEQAEEFFKSRGIEIRPMFYPMLAHSSFVETYALITLDYEEHNAVTLNQECLILPSYPELSLEEQKFIIKTVYEYISSFRS